MEYVRFHHHVISRPVAIWSCLPVSGDTRIYQFWIVFAKASIVETVLFQRIGQVILYKDVGFFRESANDIHTFFLLERYSYRFLVPIELQITQYVSELYN